MLTVAHGKGAENVQLNEDSRDDLTEHKLDTQYAEVNMTEYSVLLCSCTSNNRHVVDG